MACRISVDCCGSLSSHILCQHLHWCPELVQISEGLESQVHSCALPPVAGPWGSADVIINKWNIVIAFLRLLVLVYCGLYLRKLTYISEH
jgi:hypothetical protein